MGYEQLVQPDLSVTGRVGLCLQYARNVFHGDRAQPTAWQAWLATQHKHTDSLPTNVAYPIWFSFWGTIDGVYANFGHVVVHVPGRGYYSSPWKQGTTNAILKSISEVERIYGVKYVGWSEDILDLRVIQEGGSVMATPATEGDIDKVIKMGLRREPRADELRNTDWLNDIVLCIRTVWGNGGETNYHSPSADDVKPYDGPQLFVKK